MRIAPTDEPEFDTDEAFRRDEPTLATRCKARPIRVEGEVAYVTLTKGYEAIIDASDAQLVGMWNWCADVSGGNAYATRGDWRGSDQRVVRMHREILAAPAGFDVDHIDGNKLNNRRSNLRLATRAENNRNRARRRDNKSGFKGVTKHSSGRWRATIKANGKFKHLGVFDTPQEAHAAYLDASRYWHGEFGRGE